jgi:tetratricopeptide (TPR) repeat protein
MDSTTLSKSQISLLLAGTLVLVFGQVVQFGFHILDDQMYVENIYVRKGLTWEGLVWVFTNVHSNFSTTLNWVSHMLDVEIFGQNPAGHHLTSLLLHITNTVLFFWIIERMTGNSSRSAIAALLFAFHPLRVETVVWVADRKDLLAMLFALMTIAAYLNYVTRRRVHWYAITALCFLLALLAKPVLVVLPAVLLLLDFWPLRRTDQLLFQGESWRKYGFLFVEKVPLMLLSVIFCWTAYHAQIVAGGMVSDAQLPLYVRLAKIPVNYLYYLEKIFWPAGLTPFYPVSYNAPPVYQTVISLLFFLGTTFLFFRFYRRAPYLLIGWLWFLGTLVPVIGIIKAGWHEIADRYTYFPLIGIIVMVVWGLADGFKRMEVSRRAPQFLAGATLVLLMILSWNQTRVWSSNVTLFRHALAHTKNNILVHNNLGLALMHEGELAAAAEQFQSAIKLQPNYYLGWLNLGTARKIMQQTDKAIEAYENALKINPGAAVLHFELGPLYHQRGDGPQAIAHTQKAEQLLLKQYGLDFDKTRVVQERLQALYQKYGRPPEVAGSPETSPRSTRAS